MLTVLRPQRSTMMMFDQIWGLEMGLANDLKDGDTNLSSKNMLMGSDDTNIWHRKIWQYEVLRWFLPPSWKREATIWAPASASLFALQGQSLGNLLILLSSALSSLSSVDAIVISIVISIISSIAIFITTITIVIHVVQRKQTSYPGRGDLLPWSWHWPPNWTSGPSNHHHDHDYDDHHQHLHYEDQFIPILAHLHWLQLREEFSECSMLTIAHRLLTIHHNTLPEKKLAAKGWKGTLLQQKWYISSQNPLSWNQCWKYVTGHSGCTQWWRVKRSVFLTKAVLLSKAVPRCLIRQDFCLVFHWSDLKSFLWLLAQFGTC